MDINFPLPEIDVAALLAVTHKPGAVKLDGYPLLVYAPTEHGPGIRTEDRGVPVADIAVKSAELPDPDALAAAFGTTAGHCRQAVAYALACLPAATPGPEVA